MSTRGVIHTQRVWEQKEEDMILFRSRKVIKTAFHALST